MISIARIVKTRGVRGEVVAALLTDFPDRFQKLDTVFIRTAEGELSRETLRGCWFHSGRAVLKFEGRDDPDAAAPLVGCELQIPDDQRRPLPAGRFYHSDLVGCLVQEGDEVAGTVRDLFTVGDTVANLVVGGPDGEWMLPLAKEYIEEIDLEARRIRVGGVGELRALTVSEGPGKRKRRRMKSRGSQAPPPETTER